MPFRDRAAMAVWHRFHSAVTHNVTRHICVNSSDRKLLAVGTSPIGKHFASSNSKTKDSQPLSQPLAPSQSSDEDDSRFTWENLKQPLRIMGIPMVVFGSAFGYAWYSGLFTKKNAFGEVQTEPALVKKLWHLDAGNKPTKVVRIRALLIFNYAYV